MFTLQNKKKYHFGNFLGLSKKFTWDSSFVDALGPRDAIEIKPKSNTDYSQWVEPRNKNEYS